MPALWHTWPFSPKADFHVESDVKPLLADYRIAEGHTAVTPRSLHLWHTSEAARLLAAAQDRRIIVTHNRKVFLPLHDAWLRWSDSWQDTREGLTLHHAGILIIPLLLQRYGAHREL